jgi:hypothetical protein
MAARRSEIEQNTPRLKGLLASLARKPPTALSRKAEVAVQWEVKRGWRMGQPASGMFVRAVIVEDDAADPIGQTK